MPNLVMFLFSTGYPLWVAATSLLIVTVSVTYAIACHKIIKKNQTP